jgi:PAS domain S-box-containing protein
MAAATRVLYVDDEPDLLDIGRIFLEVSGEFSIATIDSAPAALDLLGQEQFDVIVSDYQMPEMDGIQFLIEVRTRFGQLPFILFTGKGREEIVIQALNEGADFYLQKGGEPQSQYAELSNKIRYAVNHRRAEMEIRTSHDQLAISEASLRIHQAELETQAEELRAAQLALEESRDKYLDLYDFAPVGYLTLSDKTLITTVNLTGATLLGVERGKLIRQPFSTLVDEKGSDQWYLYFRQLLNPLEKQVCTLMLIRGDGSTFPARLEGIRIADSSEGNTRVQVTISDITDIWEAERALKRSEEKYRKLVEQSSDGIWLLDKEFLTVYVNPAMEEMLGYSKDEMTGRSWYDFGDPEWVERAKELEKRRESGIGEPHEFLFIHKDGRKVLTRISTTPLCDKEGRFDGAIGVLSDITRQKQAEEAIHESREHYRTLFDTMSQGVVYQDREGRIIDANPASMRILGLSLDQMKGRSSVNPRWMPVHDDGSVFPGETHPAIVALKTGKEVRDVIMGIRHPEKEGRIWIRINSMPQFRPGEDTPYQVYSIFDDITGIFGPAVKDGKPDLIRD